MNQRIISLLMVVLILFPVWVGAMTQTERMQFADGLYIRGMYDMAAREYKEISVEYPDNPGMDVVLFRLGECWRKTGDAIASESCYARVVSQFPESEFRFKALLRRAEIARKGGRLPEATALLKGLTRQDVPTTLKPATAYELGCVYAEMDQKKKAEKTFRDLLQSYPDSSYAGFAAMELARLLKDEEGNSAEMLELYKMAAEQSTSERMGAEAWLRLADAAFQNKDYKEAARAYEQIITKYRGMLDDPQVQLQIAWTYYHAGRYADALHMINDSTQQATAKPEELYLMANCQRQLLKTKEALATYEILMKRFPDSPLTQASLYEKAWLAYQEGDFEAIIQQADLTTPSEDMNWLLAEAYAALDQPDKATQYYKLLISGDDESGYAPRAMYRLARLLRQREDCLQAVPMYEKLVAQYPDSELAPQSLVEAAWCLTEMKEDAKAIREWGRLVESYPESKHVEDALYQKAMLEVRLERHKSALKTCKQLLKQYPDSSMKVELHFWMGVLYEKEEAWDDAKKSFEAALQADPESKQAWRINYHLAGILQHQDDPAGAAEIVQALLDGTSHENEIPHPLLNWLIRYRLEQQDYALAESAVRTLLVETESNADLQRGYYFLGQALAGQQKTTSAMDAYKKAMQQDARTPEGARAALQSGMLALETQSFTDAEEAFRTSAAWASGSDLMVIRARSYYGLGLTEMERENYEEAARYFMSVGVLYDHPELVPECLYLASEAFRQAGQPKKQHTVLEELQQRYPDSPWTNK